MEEKSKDKSGILIRLFEEGKQFTEEVLKENERLRLLLARLKAESEAVPSAAVEPAFHNELEKTRAENNRYKEELDRLKKALADAEKENQEFANQYVEVEQQNQSILNLYVASHRLHSTLDIKEVISTIKEIVINLIGSETFGIFIKDENEDALKLLAHEGLEDREVGPVPLGNSPAGLIAESGQCHVPDSNGGGEEPIAYIPLKMQDQLLGMIIIYELLRQKDGFSPLDMELFSLIADHAATAIYCSQLHAVSERKLNTMQNLLELLKLEK